MKKVLALVLAVMMLATVAFANVTVKVGNSGYNNFKSWIPGTTIKLNDSGIVDATNPTGGTKVVDLASNYPNAQTGKTSTGVVLVKNINTDNYTVTAIKYSEGKKLVESIAINNAEERVEIKLKQQYGKTTASNLNVTFTLKGKKVGKTWKPENLTVIVNGTVGYMLDTATVQLNSNGDVVIPDTSIVYKDSAVKTAVEANFKALTDAQKKALTATDTSLGKENGKDFLAGQALNISDAFTLSDQILWEVDKPSGVTENYGELNFTAADADVDITARVYDGDKLYPYSTVSPNKTFLVEYSDEDAEISFLNFPNLTFNSTATVRIYKEEGETYFYEIADGKVYDMNGKGIDAGSAGIGKKVNWDDDEGCYVLKTREMPKTMVFSDKPLPIDETPVADTTPENPDTGANDVVGIATALAAVALVSAAAVSLKK